MIADPSRDFRRMRILNLGAGVQSTVVALLIHRKEVEPIDAAIFADTGWEGDGTMAHLDWLEAEVADSFPVHRVKGSNPPHITGNLREDVMVMAKNSQAGKKIAPGRNPNPPLFTTSQTGGRGILSRKCTETYKVVPIVREIRRLAGFKKGQTMKGVHVDQLFGISWDERQRMREAQEKWSTFHYPLIDRYMTRGHCIEWLQKNGYPRAPRSACIACPYRRNKEWQEMKKNRPTEWADAVEFDETVRGGLNGTREQLYVHESLVPLAEIDFDDEGAQQEFSFIDECGGHCGV